MGKISGARDKLAVPCGLVGGCRFARHHARDVQETGLNPRVAGARHIARFFRTSRSAAPTPCKTTKRPGKDGTAHRSLLSCPPIFHQNHPPILRQPTMTKIRQKPPETAHKIENFLVFLADVPAGQFFRRRYYVSQTNHMLPDRRRRFYLAIKQWIPNLRQHTTFERQLSLTKPIFAASKPLLDSCPLFISQSHWCERLALGHFRHSSAVSRAADLVRSRRCSIGCTAS